MTMPRSREEIIKHAEDLARHFEEGFQPTGTPEEAELRAAVFRRAQAEREIGKAVEAAREAKVPWHRIGEALGTSGEAARQRYSDAPPPGDAGKPRVRTGTRDIAGYKATWQKKIANAQKPAGSTPSSSGRKTRAATANANRVAAAKAKGSQPR
jgi:hypothetical protein